MTSCGSCRRETYEARADAAGYGIGAWAYLRLVDVQESRKTRHFAAAPRRYVDFGNAVPQKRPKHGGDRQRVI
jgi:hypothetical protein